MTVASSGDPTPPLPPRAAQRRGASLSASALLFLLGGLAMTPLTLFFLVLQALSITNGVWRFFLHLTIPGGIGIASTWLAILPGIETAPRVLRLCIGGGIAMGSAVSASWLYDSLSTGSFGKSDLVLAAVPQAVGLLALARLAWRDLAAIGAGRSTSE